MSRKVRNILIILGSLLLIVIGFILVKYSLATKNTMGKVIVIDAGHGDKDPGTTSINGDFEKDINLDIAKLLNKDLKKRGYRTLLVRKEDVFIDLEDRANFANENKGLVFISIHCNAIENNEEVNGLQVLHYPEIKESMDLSNLVMENMLLETGAMDRGIIPRDKLVVLNQTKMPAIIVECGFLTNRKEAELLTSKDYQRKISKGIGLGIEAYIQDIKDKAK